MRVAIEPLLERRDIRRRLFVALDRLVRRSGADSAILAFPVSGTGAFRVVTFGLRDIPFGEVSLPISDSPVCARVLGRQELVGIQDTRELPPDEVCAFLLAEDFAGFLGAPVFPGGVHPAAVVAALTHRPRDWKLFDRALVLEAAAIIGRTLSGTGTDSILPVQ